MGHITENVLYFWAFLRNLRKINKKFTDRFRSLSFLVIKDLKNNIK
jgi:hypothetical protein